MKIAIIAFILLCCSTTSIYFTYYNNMSTNHNLQGNMVTDINNVYENTFQKSTTELKEYEYCKIYTYTEFCIVWFFANDRNSKLQLKDLKGVVKEMEKISKFYLPPKILPHLAKILDAVLRIINSNLNKVKGVLTRSILKYLEMTLHHIEIGEEGCITAITPLTAILVTNVTRSDVIGVAATFHDNKEISHITPLFANDTSAKIENASMIVKLEGNIITDCAVFILFDNSNFLQEYRQQVQLTSPVIGVTLHENTEGFSGVMIEMQPYEISENIRQCAFYDLENCKWNTDGCDMIRYDNSSGRDVCYCSHLTNFGVVIGLNVTSIALDIISDVGSILSLIGLLIIFLTAIIFSSWRSQLGNKILIHLSCTITMLLCIFLYIEFGNTINACDNTGCIALGAVMHYATLASFCWMLVTAGLQYLRLVAVLTTRPSHFLLKGAIFAWGVPIIPVLVAILTGANDVYYQVDFKDGQVCYSQELAMYTLVIPVSAAIVVNFILFCIIVYYVTCGRDKNIKINITIKSERKLKIRQFKFFILLFFLLGLTWIFGLIGLLIPNEETWQISFTSIFCILATLQGFILFIFFILCDKKASELWISQICRIFRIKRVKSRPSSAIPSIPSNDRPEDIHAPPISLESFI